MIRSFLLAFYRTTARHPLYAVLNVLGLAFGIAVFIIISLHVRFEATFDEWIPQASRIYEVGTANLALNPEARPEFASPGLALDEIRTLMPQVKGTRLVKTFSVFRIDDEPIEEEEYLADASVFEIFDLSVVAGSTAGALRPDTIVLNETMARKYFGHTDIVGRRLILSDLIGGVMHVPDGASDPRAYTVTAVIRDTPANSSLNFQFIRLLTPERIAMFRNWGNWEARLHRTFVYLDRADQAQRLNARLDTLVDTRGRSPFVDAQFPGTPRHDHYRVRLVPLTSEHLADRKAMASVLALGILGVLAFAIALVNYINLATARITFRAREAALRRTLGATAGELRLQFLAEAVFMSLLALVLSFSFVELTLPLINHLGGTSLRLDYIQAWPFLGWLTVAVILCGAAAGLYPAFVMASFQPAEVFASARAPSAGRLPLKLREVLVFVQFTLVSAFLIVVFGFATQLRHLQTSQLGFDREGLLITNALINNTLDAGKSSAVTAQWVALPNVKSITSGMTPGRYFSQSVYAVTPAGRSQPSSETAAFLIGDHYFSVFGTPILAGRELSHADQVGDELLAPFGHVPATVNVVINQRLSRGLGFATPQAALGQDLQLAKVTLHVVGVVADQRLDSPANEIMPAFYLSLHAMTTRQPTILKYEGVPEDVMRARLTAVWRRLAPDVPLDLVSGSEALDHYYDADRRMTRLFVMGACLVGLIGVIGLYGMAAFSTSARSLEIGLRKAMGGSRLRIARLLVVQFLRPVVLANLAAWPIAWLVLDHWFKQFNDRVAMTPWFFLAGSGLSFVIAVVTVAGLTLKTARLAPGKTLRHE